MYYKIVNTVLAFFILFGFKLPVFYNSTVLAAILIIVIRPEALFSVSKFFKEKYVRKIFFYLFLLIFLSVFVALYNQTLEFAIIRPLFNQLFIFFTVLLFYISLDKKVSVDESHWYLINAYVLQSIIILLAYNISAFEHFVRLFQPEDINELATEGYQGFRALSLSAGSFFWVSGAYALLFLVVSYKILEKKPNLWSGISFFILFAGALFTGRTIYFGIFISLVFFLINRNFRTLIKPLLFTSFVILILLFTLPKSFYDSDFYQWTFELFINYNETGSFSTSSTEGLVDDMLYMPELKTLLIGDGLWANDGVTQAFYGGTDSGYMRVLLFYGITGLAAYFLYARFITFGLSKIPQLNNKLGLRFLYVLMILQLILNIKGQSMSYMTSTQTILFMFFIPYVFNQKKVL